MSKVVQNKIKKVIKNCRNSADYFLNRYCKIKHPSAGIIPFTTFSYQKKQLRLFQQHRFNIFSKTRQAGISTLSGGYALWFSMFFGNKTTLITSKRDNDAKEFMGKNIKFVFKHLPIWMQEIWAPTVDNEHEFGFSNGSVIKSLPSGPETLRQFSSSLNIIDEASVTPYMEEMWSSAWPTLQHGGACLSPDSLITTKNGLISIDELPKSTSVFWENNWHQVEALYHSNKIKKTIRIITDNGHYIEATPDHKFMVVTQTGKIIWKKVSNITFDDEMILSSKLVKTGSIVKLNTNINDYIRRECQCRSGCRRCKTMIALLKNKSRPAILDERLANLLGLIWGDGFIQDTGRFGISCNGGDIVNYVKQVVRQLLSVKCRVERHHKDISVRWNSKSLFLVLELNNIHKESALNLSVPTPILSAKNKIKAAFLRGLFEADGCISSHRIKYSTGSIKLARQIQTILLSMGMRTRLIGHKRVNGHSDNMSYNVQLKTRDDVLRFRKYIGFLGRTKQNKLNNVPKGRNNRDRFTNKYLIEEFYVASIGLGHRIRQAILQRVRKNSVSRHFARSLMRHSQLRKTKIGQLVEHELFTDRIKSLKTSMSLVHDAQINDVHAYVANGFLSHNCLVIATSKGVGNWYWKTWTDAEEGLNVFNPIVVEWWDMDWEIRYTDSVSKQEVIISPTRGIRECKTEEERKKYGPYWSPWLEEQYHGLVAKGGEGHFRQEILRDFLGSGRPVLDREVLVHIRETVNDKFEIINTLDYVHPVTGESYFLEFQNGLQVWKKPVPEHTYSMGVDISSGEDWDWSAIEIIDVTTLEQVAELQIKCTPAQLIIIADFLGRWYNIAFMVPERTGLGVTVCQGLESINYPSLWRRNMMFVNKKDASKDTRSNKIGFNTTKASKPMLVKSLIDNLGENGYCIYSHRCRKQLETYVHLGGGRTGAETGSMNDDLPIALSLAFVGAEMAATQSNVLLLPYVAPTGIKTQPGAVVQSPGKPKLVIKDHKALMPVNIQPTSTAAIDTEQQVKAFTKALTAHTNEDPKAVSRKKDNGALLLSVLKK